MGNKQSTARPGKTREGTTSPPSYTESSTAKEKTSSMPSDSKSPLEKPKQQPEAIKSCKRCSRQYLESQLNNNLVDSKCRRYHPAAPPGMKETQTRREMLLERNNTAIPLSHRKQHSLYYGHLVWTCCIQPCLPHETGGYSQSNGCKYHDGKHES